MLDFTELSSHLTRVNQLMKEHDLDVVIAIDWSRDEILFSHQRWLTGFTPLGQPGAILVFKDGHAELLSTMLGRTVPEFYSKSGLPIETVAGFSPALFAERVSRAGAKRIGYVEDGAFPASIYQALRGLEPSPEIVDISAEMLQLRRKKSATEISAIRKSCEIADFVWSKMPEIFKPGRKFYEVIADIEHLSRLKGAEGGFYLISKLPFLGMPMRVVADPEEIVTKARYLVEVSPRYDGYYSQLTSPVTTTPADEAIASAYSAIVDAKEFAQPRMVPGADLSEIAADVDKFIAERGQKMASKSLGHFCGMALEEPRHDPSKPYMLEKDMTLIFHPVLLHPQMNSLMRGDTYLIGDKGAERLNKYDRGMLQLG